MRPGTALLAGCTLLACVLASGCSADEREASSLPQPVPQTEGADPRGDVAAPGAAADTAAVAGQTVYVPAYSHVFFQDGTREFDLTTTLSVRNTDPALPITVRSVRYHDSSGQLVRRYLEAPLPLAPLASRAFVVEERDRSGGVGANFIVEWEAPVPVSPPIVEAVMISTAGTQGISFVSRGQAIRSFGERNR